MRVNTASRHMISIPGTPYEYDATRLGDELRELRQRVGSFRSLVGTLSAEALGNLRTYFRLKNIYNSNAIEGNQLTMGETKMVIQEGLTITGKPLKDTLEAKNLDHALDYLEKLAKPDGVAVTEREIRQIHGLILKDIDTRIAGVYRSVFVQISGSAFEPPDPARLNHEMAEFGGWLGGFTRQGDASHTLPAFIDPVALACVAHTWFVSIHSFQDGNGRTARTLLNLVLLRSEYPLAILTKDDRQRYYDALEESQAGDLTPFIQLVVETLTDSLDIYEQAGRLPAYSFLR